jgi:TRAP transporter 4TM/12TM fusion protein
MSDDDSQQDLDAAATPYWRSLALTIISVTLSYFVLVEVNAQRLQPISALAVFAGLGLAACYLTYPLAKRWKDVAVLRWVDVLLAAACVFVFAYIIVQTEPLFKDFWLGGKSIGDRAGAEPTADIAIGIAIVLLVLEGTRRSIGLIVPALASVFILHAWHNHLVAYDDYPSVADFCNTYLPWINNYVTVDKFLMVNSGETLTNLSTVIGVQSQGVLGQATSVMFRYVFLFVVFGAFLEISGATRFIIGFSQRTLGHLTGGPALMSVFSSCLMGSLSGSAVANAVTTGAFTIPMMRNSGFKRHEAAAVEAAAGSGGALVPPVMGAAAYMMLELVQPSVTFQQICLAAMIPAALYYLSLAVIVYLHSCKIGTKKLEVKKEDLKLDALEGVTFFLSLAVLITLLLFKFTPFKAVTAAMAFTLFLTTFRADLKVSAVQRHLSRAAFGIGIFVFVVWSFTGEGLFVEENQDVWATYRNLIVNSAICGMLVQLTFGLIASGWRPYFLKAMKQAARNGISLVAASACVGIIIAVVGATGMADSFGSGVKEIVESSLLLALVGIMICSLVLGMGVPSVVCYLLMAALMGTLLDQLGVIPLSAHLFIFYFGMMSMVTPPVALAAYAAASIAEAQVMKTAVTAFKFALVGFTLPYMFVYRPALLLMNGPMWEAWMAAKAAGASNQAELLAAAQNAFPSLGQLIIAVGASVIGVVALAIALTGYFLTHLHWLVRVCMFLSAALLMAPNVGGREMGAYINLGGVLLFAVLIGINIMRAKNVPPAARAL